MDNIDKDKDETRKTTNYSPQFIEETIEEFRGCADVSASSFAKSKGIPKNTFYGWLKRHGSQGEARKESGIPVAAALKSRKEAEPEDTLYRFSVSGIQITAGRSAVGIIMEAIMHADD